MTGFQVLIAAAAIVGGVAMAMGEVRTQTVEYRDGDTVLEGYLAWDDAVSGKRPGVLVVHEWWGLNDYAKLRARQLAQMGYVAFAADIYGKGRRATTAQEAGELAGEFRKNPALLVRRATAGLLRLKADDRVDADRLAAIGFCFGGTTVLELARSGAPLRAAVSFHGGLGTTTPAKPGDIKAAVLVLHGADDPHVSPEQLSAFKKEMRDAGVDWQLISYGGAVHAFTNPAAGDDPSRGAAYNAKAAARSWAAMQLFFDEVLRR